MLGIVSYAGKWGKYRDMFFAGYIMQLVYNCFCLRGICIIIQGGMKVIFFIFSYSKEGKANKFSQIKLFVKLL